MRLGDCAIVLAARLGASALRKGALLLAIRSAPLAGSNSHGRQWVWEKTGSGAEGGI